MSFEANGVVPNAEMFGVLVNLYESLLRRLIVTFITLILDVDMFGVAMPFNVDRIRGDKGAELTLVLLLAVHRTFVSGNVLRFLCRKVTQRALEIALRF